MNNELRHHGVLGMKWGCQKVSEQRRYPDPGRKEKRSKRS